MKIELELDRDEAHELNALISYAFGVYDKSTQERRSRDVVIAVSTWNEAYLEAMQNDEE